MAETPFKIAVLDEQIIQLRQKLATAVFPDELDDAGWDYGAPLVDIRRLVARWQDGYDWRKYEARLNEELPQFTRDIEVDGFGKLNIHYIHKKSKVFNAIPLLFVHGWPGSFLEIRKILPLLLKGSSEHPSFHVVAFSLPGFGFSEAPRKKGFELAQFAEVIPQTTSVLLPSDEIIERQVGNKLMLALGYNEYVTQGGDWGSLITRKLAQLYGPRHSKAWHTNTPLAPPPHPTRRPLLFFSHLLLSYTAEEKKGLERSQWYQQRSSGYLQEQSTQPQTLGYGLADSPVGLLAWIYEKLVAWTDEYPWDDDEVLTWISIYWFSRAGPAASLRIYYEVVKANPRLLNNPKSEPTTIPMGHSYFPKEVVVLPRRWHKASNLVFESKHKEGGHFAAHEKPQELVEDLRKMFGRGGPAFVVVPEKNGYAWTRGNSFPNTGVVPLMAETPFKIAISDEQISRLRQKLAMAVFPDELDDAGWDYGAPLVDIRRLVARWQDGYDWRKHEAQLNEELPQFTRDIEVDGFGKLNIHYIHKKSEVVNAIPLLFVHGWPGSFYEIRKILPLLLKGSSEQPSFHVVTFSLPGFGFSEAPKKKGFELAQFAEVGNKLMLALGYNEYVTQGGDWGFFITRKLAQLYGPSHSKAWHTNLPLAPAPHPFRRPLLFLSHLLFSYTTEEKKGLERGQWYFQKSSGYFQEQSTQPQTLGYGLADSPVGLLGWIYEKLVVWTDEYPWDDDEVLTWISIYWFSRAGPAASLRIYHEVVKANPGLLSNPKPQPTTIPMGHSYFPKEIIVPPRRWLKASNLVFESQHKSGGHFASHEKPQELAEDLRKMFGRGGPAFGVVPGKNGYA
ncbi:hypothetical protein CVT25_000400 [Psilocybe cyanescens]|uniref:Epoxide hydrolase N-terminal domain-containing protein n=1 Tax=Psilocybe cyanescens TaxID=93625 RepID=A0A409XUJ0_PSICY|nr:hypothetical protein CVT25_000400 [Psilocybe cyanescens]